MRSKSISIPLLQWQRTSHLSKLTWNPVAASGLPTRGFTFPHQDLYIGTCILHFLGFRMDLLNLQAVQTNGMHCVSPAQPMERRLAVCSPNGSLRRWAGEHPAQEESLLRLITRLWSTDHRVGQYCSKRQNTLHFPKLYHKQAKPRLIGSIEA